MLRSHTLPNFVFWTLKHISRYETQWFEDAWGFLVFSKYFGSKKSEQGKYLVNVLEVPKMFQNVLEYVQKPL